MGKSYIQILEEARKKVNVSVKITIVSNQDNGIVGYTTGDIYFSLGSPGKVTKDGKTVGFHPDEFNANKLEYYFSDRMLDVEPPPLPGSGGFGHSAKQPFSTKAADNLGVTISQDSFGRPVAKFVLHSWGDTTFNIPLEVQDNLLIGVGQPVGTNTDHAFYIIALHDLVVLTH